MIHNENGLDFQPDLTPPVDNIKQEQVKTSVSLDSNTLLKLKAKTGISVSSYINTAVKERLEIEKYLLGNIYGKQAKDYTKIELLLPIEVAQFLLQLVALNGEIPVANKIADVLYTDSACFMLGRIHEFTNKTKLDFILSGFDRASKRLDNFYR